MDTSNGNIKERIKKTRKIPRKKERGEGEERLGGGGGGGGRERKERMRKVNKNERPTQWK